MNIKAMVNFRLDFIISNLTMLITNFLFMGAILYLAYQTEGFGLLTFEEFIFSFAVGNIAYILALNFFSGLTKMQQTIISGDFDKLLLRPISAYTHILFHKINPFALAEILTAIIFLVLVPVTQWPLLFFFSLCSAVILHYTIVAYNTLPFYIDMNSDVHFWDLLVTFLFYPTYMTNAITKFFSFVVFPGALVTFGPVLSMKFPLVGLLYFGYLVGIVIIATILFKKGLKRYRSAGY